jgi:predicted HTH transcriptional regulator
LTFCPLEVNGEKVVLLKIPAASTVPVKFMGIAYARIGEATPKLADFPEREAALLAKLRPFAWEAGVAVDFVQGVEVLALLDHEAYFRLTGQRRPDNIEAVLDHLAKDRLIVRDVGGRWGILNLGAMLFAKDLKEFGSLSRKAPRVVRYQGNDRTKTERETEGNRGYALAFERLIDFVNSSLPSHERVGKALREQEYVYPEIAVRELVANGLIHQDLTITGAGPMIEIFADRVELTNPGRPLIEPRRFMDLPPRSRNENLASLMRRMKICEERGSGIDKVVAAVELAQLPPPDFLSLEDNTRAILYGPRKFLDMDATERLRACYWHAVLKFVRSEGMTNATLRERLGVEERNSSQISRLIGQAVDAGLIKQSESFNARTGYYLPFWA